MFIHNLNFEQQSTLLYLAHEVAKADGNLDELQLGMMSILKAQSQQGVEEKPISDDKLHQLFDTERAKCSLLLELLGVAHANSEYHLAEKDLISKYANLLGVPQDKLQALEHWVEAQMALSAHAEQLLTQP